MMVTQNTQIKNKNKNKSTQARREGNPNKGKKPGRKPNAPKVPNPKMDSKRKTSKSDQTKNITTAITAGLKDIWEIYDIRPKSDDFIIDSITGKRTSFISHWPSIRIQRARIIAAITTKIKSSAPLRSDDDTVLEFIKTQDEPILGTRYLGLLKDKVDEVFESFPYQEVLDEVKDPDRVKMVTNGSSFPQALAPVITGVNSNVELLVGMSAGEDIFKSDFDSRSILTGVADGKVTTVPKNWKTSRVITLAPRALVDEQQVISVALRDWITLRSRDKNHIIQFDDQTVQHKLLLEGYATLDLSSASDRIYLRLLKKVWPKFHEYFGEYLPKDVVTDAGRIVPLTCVGTQGFPLTFTLMAIISGLIVEAVKMHPFPSANYGDDIICHLNDFEEVYVALESLGLVINKGKTHKSSDGFLESCGMDVRFTPNGARNITPIFLRGTSDIEVVQFFHQLCDAKLIEPDEAINLMSRLNIEFYAYDYAYQLTEFHFPHGDVVKNVPRAQWSEQFKHYVCKVPAMAQTVDSIKGLSKKESDVVLHLLHIEAGLKIAQPYTHRGLDPVARQYGIIDLQDERLYPLVKRLDDAESQVHIFYKEIMEEFKITFKTILFYRFITSEMNRYKYSTPTVDFSQFSTKELTMSEFIDSEFGINSEIKYPIYRYKPEKSYKFIVHPKSNEILGVDSESSLALR